MPTAVILAGSSRALTLARAAWSFSDPAFFSADQRPMLPLAALAVLLPAATSPAPAARNPAFARDGRLAVSVDGDLWVRSTAGAWTHITSGGAWDREPAWTPDGAALVFSSDRSGAFSLWRVPVGPNGAASEPTRLTTSTLPDAEPAVARDGRIIFVRGRLGAAELWSLAP